MPLRQRTQAQALLLGCALKRRRQLWASDFEVSFQDTTIRFALKRPTPAVFDVVTERTLPNPLGDEWLDGEFTLRSDGQTPVAMEGWLVRDAADQVWTLGSMGTIAPGSSATIRRNGMPVGLINGAAEIVLLDPQGREQDRLAYGGTEEGVWIETGH